MNAAGSRVGRVLGTADATPLQFWVAVARRRLPAARRRGGHPAASCPTGEPVDDRRRGHRRSGPGTRARSSTPTCSPSPTARCPPRCRRRPRSPPPGSTRRSTCRRRPARSCTGPRARPATSALLLRPDGAPDPDRASAATACRSSSTPTSSTAAAARTCPSPASPAWRPRPASPRSCSTRCSAPGVLGGRRAANTKALIFNVKGEDLLFLDHPNTRLDDAHPRRPTPASACPPARSPTCGSTPRRGPATPSGTPDVSSRLDRRGPVLLDARRVLRRPRCCRTSSPTPTTSASSTRWWSTRSPRTWRRHAQSRPRAAVSIDGTRISSLRRPGRLPRRRSSPTTSTRSAWAGSAVGLGTVNAFARRLIAQQAGPGPADPRRPGHPPPAPINTAESAQVTVVDLHNLPDRAQRFVVGVTLKTRVRAQGEGRHRASRCCSWCSTS